MSLSQAEQSLGYTFKDKSLLTRALTLPSANGENNNQTMEFFGDAVLEFLVSERIFQMSNSEGMLTEWRKSLVSDSALTPVSKKLGLDKLLIRNPHDCNNKKAVPSVYEAVVAAIYLDGGMDEARKFVYATIDFSKVRTEDNFKGCLQELAQSLGESLPSYSNENIGTPQKPKFSAKVSVLGQTFEGVAETVRAAEQAAAKSAYNSLKNKQ